MKVKDIYELRSELGRSIRNIPDSWRIDPEIWVRALFLGEPLYRTDKSSGKAYLDGIIWEEDPDDMFVFKELYDGTLCIAHRNVYELRFSDEDRWNIDKCGFRVWKGGEN